jgi:hypothetical protein
MESLQQLEEARTAPHPIGAILLIGSSSASPDRHETPAVTDFPAAPRDHSAVVRLSILCG